jgi:hypothetical protein
MKRKKEEREEAWVWGIKMNGDGQLQLLAKHCSQ